MNSALIELSEVSFSYETAQGLLPVLKNINLRVREGEFVALLGANGSGKSTLCKLIAGLLVPQTGEINGTLDRYLTGLMLANPEDQLVCPLVEEEIAFGPQNLGVPYSELIKCVQESLKILDLSPMRHKLTHLLSGGEQQKVVLASLLALKPRCLILDEAASFLDSAQQQLVRESIQHLHKKHGLGIIWSTPSVEEVLLAERVIVLQRGGVVFEGSPAQLLAQIDMGADWGLLWPDLYCLLDRLKSDGFNFSETIVTAAQIAQVLTSTQEDCCREERMPSKIEKLQEDAAQAESPLISLKNITFKPATQQAGEAPILNKINLDVYEGEFIGISGHTGCGKSTLLQHINGLLEPSEGQVLIGGEDIHKNRKYLQEIRRQIGLVFQYPERQFFNSTIEEEIAFAPHQAGMNKEQVAQNSEEVLGWLGMDFHKLRNRSAYELSGGEKRKLAIACVLVMKPRVLMLDEPTAGLDGHNKRDMLGLIKRMQHELGLTVVMVSHDLCEIMNLADQLLLLHDGEMYWSGYPVQLLAQPELLPPLGLPLPALWELVARLKQQELDFAPAGLTVDGVYREIKKYFTP